MTVDSALARARAAQAEIEHWGQERVDELVAAVGWHVYQEDNARRLAELAHDESGLGDREHLFALHRRRVLGTLRDLHGVMTVGVIEELPERGITKFAKPVGVIAVASPATAPCSGIACNALQMLKTRNAVVVAPNPRARAAAALTVETLRLGLAQVGAPLDLLQCLDTTERETTEQLMAAADLVVAAGGAGTVRRAYRSGTPAISAGTGNPVVIVDETADVAAAVERIVLGASYNNGTSCSSESNVLVHASVEDAFIEELDRRGGHVCDEEQAARLRRALWSSDGRLNRAAIGRSAGALAADAGISLAENDKTTALVIRCSGPSDDDPVFGEKLAPVFTLMTFHRFEDALSAVDALIARGGQGHSCGIHTALAGRVAALAARVKVCRVMVNQSTAVGNSGSFDNGMPFTSTISSGTWGGCSESENITWRHFLNITSVSRPIEPRIPSEDMIFGQHWSQYGV